MLSKSTATLVKFLYPIGEQDSKSSTAGFKIKNQCAALVGDGDGWLCGLMRIYISWAHTHASSRRQAN